MEKQNLTQQKTHSPIKTNVLQHKINGQGLFWFQHLTNLSHTYLLRQFPTYLQLRNPHRPFGQQVQITN